MAIEITVPALGESVTEATVGQWFKKPGDAVAVDEPLVELETDKVTVEVPAPSAGVLSEIKVPQGSTVAVGAVLGAIDGVAASLGRTAPAAEPAAQPTAQASATPPGPASKPAPEQQAPAGDRAASGADMPAAPAARKIMAEKGLAGADVVGSGRRGQILKEDAVAAATRQGAAAAAAAAFDAAASQLPASVPAPAPQRRAPSG